MYTHYGFEDDMNGQQSNYLYRLAFLEPGMGGEGGAQRGQGRFFGP